MLTSFVEAFLTRNPNIVTKSILGARRSNHSRILAPGMHKDISGRDNVRSTVRNDVQIADKLDTTVDGLTTDEWNTTSSQIIECTPNKYLPNARVLIWHNTKNRILWFIPLQEQRF